MSMNPFNGLTQFPPELNALLSGGPEKIAAFVSDAGKTMAGFREMPDSLSYKDSLHDIMFRLGVDKTKLPEDPKVWQGLAYRFQAYSRVLIDFKDRDGVSSTLPQKIYERIAAAEKLPDAGTLDRLQFDVAKIFAEKRDATDAEKAAATAGLKELPKQFVDMGFVGFGCALNCVTSDSKVVLATLFHANAVLSVPRGDMITTPPRPNAGTPAFTPKPAP